MDGRRFKTLADAYGGAISRWPKDIQDAAWAFLAEEPDTADGVLAAARRLDVVLDSLTAPSASMGLRAQILAAAPRMRSAHDRVRRWLLGAGVGAGLAAATVAGLVAGVTLSSARVSDSDLMLAAVYAGDPLDSAEDPS